MGILCLILTVLTPLPQTDADKRAAVAFERFQIKFISILAEMDAKPRNHAALLKHVAEELRSLVQKYGQQLRPKTGSRKYVSRDGKFVLVVGASGSIGDGTSARAEDPQASIVMAVGGDGGPGQADIAPGSGGGAVARAPEGVAVALGGAGGAGAFPRGGGGGGGGVGVDERIGSIAFGGLGGPGMGGGGIGGDGGGRQIVNAKAIAALAHKLIDQGKK